MTVTWPNRGADGSDKKTVNQGVVLRRRPTDMQTIKVEILNKTANQNKTTATRKHIQGCNQNQWSSYRFRRNKQEEWSTTSISFTERNGRTTVTKSRNVFTAWDFSNETAVGVCVADNQIMIIFLDEDDDIDDYFTAYDCDLLFKTTERVYLKQKLTEMLDTNWLRTYTGKNMDEATGYILSCHRVLFKGDDQLFAKVTGQTNKQTIQSKRRQAMASISNLFNHARQNNNHDS